MMDMQNKRQFGECLSEAGGRSTYSLEAVLPVSLAFTLEPAAAGGRALLVLLPFSPLGLVFEIPFRSLGFVFKRPYVDWRPYNIFCKPISLLGQQGSRAFHNRRCVHASKDLLLGFSERSNACIHVMIRTCRDFRGLTSEQLFAILKLGSAGLVRLLRRLLRDKGL
jgi:hypothetical protein